MQIHMHLKAVCRDYFVLALIILTTLGVMVFITSIPKDVAGDMQLKCRNRVLK